jgi:outer membrane immunogenic protein
LATSGAAWFHILRATLPFAWFFRFCFWTYLETTMFCRTRTLALLIFCLLGLTSNDVAAGGFGPIVNTVSGAGSANASSGLAGAHAGYNWQQGGVVFGFETDLQGTHLVSTVNPALIYVPPTPGLTDFARAQSTIDWYGTFRGRLGTTFGPLMVYLTGGVAYGNVDLSTTFSAFGFTTQAQNSQTRVGGVGGFGLEYMLQPNLFVSFNYQYVDLGKLNANSSTTVPLGFFAFATLNQSASVHAQFQTATVGLTWRFAPAASGPWAGGYAGVQGGGAWGNSTSGAYNGVATFIPN